MLAPVDWLQLVQTTFSGQQVSILHVVVELPLA